MNISDTLRTMYVGPLAETNFIDGDGDPIHNVDSLVSGSTRLEELPLAMAYVPMQSWGETYDGLKALDSGTIFPELDLPFCGRRLSK